VKQVDLEGQYRFSNVASVNYQTNSMKLYPNPVMDLLTVSLPSEGSILIYNYLGQQIGKYQLTEGENTVDLTALDNGLYLLKFSKGSVKPVVKR
jgi:hypothetical protein